MKQDSLAKDESGTLIGSDKVEGTTVYNTAGEKIGGIERMMIDKLSGKIAYAVMSFGGFLGIGERYHPLPWGALNYDTNVGGYVVALDRKTLEGAPTFSDAETPNYEDRRWATQLHDYYRVPPYWG